MFHIWKSVLLLKRPPPNPPSLSTFSFILWLSFRFIICVACTTELIRGVNYLQPIPCNTSSNTHGTSSWRISRTFGRICWGDRTVSRSFTDRSNKFWNCRGMTAFKNVPGRKIKVSLWIVSATHRSLPPPYNTWSNMIILS